MKITEKQKEELKERLFENYDSYNCGLAEMIIDDFIDRIEEYDGESELQDIINDITGNYSGSYTCSTFKSAKLIAENIFEFNLIAEEMEENGYGKFEITETEINLVKVLCYICDNTILAQNCDTLEELIESL